VRSSRGSRAWLKRAAALDILGTTIV